MSAGIAGSVTLSLSAQLLPAFLGTAIGSVTALLILLTGLSTGIRSFLNAAPLVILAGKPRFEKIEGTGLKFAANTNWSIYS